MKRLTAQRGFTLIELLIALALVLVVLVSVQRYIAGVTVDHQGISERRAQATQTRIALSNMQRDVAQAGYFPYANELDNDPNFPIIGVTTSENTLTVASYQPAATARDCRNAGVFKDTQNLNKLGWILVVNTYSVVNGSLSCNGNGSEDRASVLDHVSQMRITNQSSVQPSAQTVQVCLVTSESSTSIGGVPTSTMCDGTAVVSKPDTAYFKIIADMPVYAASFKAGQ